MNLFKKWLPLLASVVLLAVGAAAAYAQETVEVSVLSVTNVRSGPDTTYTIIGRLLPSETVTANGRSSTSNDWLRIDFEGEEGWVAARVVAVSGDPTLLDVVSPSNAESQVGVTGVTVQLTDETNIRIGPGSNYRIMTQGTAGSAYDVTGRTAFDDTVMCRDSRLIDLARGEAPDDVWLRVNSGGVDGWVSYSAVSVSGNLCDVEVAAMDAELSERIESLSSTVFVITTDSVRLRASNYPGSEILAVIPFDTSLTAEAQNDDGSRIRVTYGEQTGWIASAYVEVTLGSVGNLPVELE